MLAIFQVPQLRLKKDCQFVCFGIVIRNLAFEILRVGFLTAIVPLGSAVWDRSFFFVYFVPRQTSSLAQEIWFEVLVWDLGGPQRLLSCVEIKNDSEFNYDYVS